MAENPPLRRLRASKLIIPNRARRRLALILALLLCAGSVSDAWAAKRKKWQPEGKRIRAIRIDHRDIFDTEVKREDKPIYRLINKLHFSTKDFVIKQELLFKEGGIYDLEMSRESERALRSILRLRKVKITTVPVDAETVDVVVRVQETWSTEPILSFSGVGEDLDAKIGLREKNFFGYGKQVSYIYKTENGVVSRTYSYDDPNIFNTHLRASLDYDNSGAGLDRRFFLSRPFYSSVTPWSASLGGQAQEMDNKVYENGEEVRSFRNEIRDLSFNYSLSLYSTPRRIRRVGLGYRYLNEQEFATVPAAALQKERRYHIVNTGVMLEKVNFLTVDHIKLYTADEDFNLGPSLTLAPGFSTRRIKNADPATFLTINTFAGKEHKPSCFSLLTFKGEGRYELSAWQDARSRLDYEYYNHFSPRQTLAFHLQGEYLAGPSADSQILLGGDTGLRGFQLNQFEGNKLFLANVENRYYWIEELLNIVGVGGATFFDAGHVWKRGETMDFGELKINVGAGLRLFIERSSLGHVLRFDVAYSLTPVPGESRTVFTFGAEQAF